MLSISDMNCSVFHNSSGLKIAIRRPQSREISTTIRSDTVVWKGEDIPDSRLVVEERIDRQRIFKPSGLIKPIPLRQKGIFRRSFFNSGGKRPGNREIIAGTMNK